MAVPAKVRRRGLSGIVGARPARRRWSAATSSPGWPRPMPRSPRNSRTRRPRPPRAPCAGRPHRTGPADRLPGRQWRRKRAGAQCPSSMIGKTRGRDFPRPATAARCRGPFVHGCVPTRQQAGHCFAQNAAMQLHYIANAAPASSRPHHSGHRSFGRPDLRRTAARHRRRHRQRRARCAAVLRRSLEQAQRGRTRPAADAPVAQGRRACGRTRAASSSATAASRRQARSRRARPGPLLRVLCRSLRQAAWPDPALPGWLHVS